MSSNIFVEPMATQNAFDSCLSAASFWPCEAIAQSAWHEHAPFAFWITEAIKPRLIVELGTYYGFSYACFCQAVKRSNLITECYAVDTWLGDEHSDFYGDEVYESVKRINEPFRSFSRLLRCRFDDALSQFKDQSIDLLHIDGRHRYEDVRSEFQNWFPKMSSRGVMLFHDTSVRKDDFGVWRFWDEIRGSFPSFEFSHCFGLGVLAVGKDLPPALLPLFSASDSEADAIRRSYAQLGLVISQQYELNCANKRCVDLAAAREQSDKRMSRIAYELSRAKSAIAEQETRYLDALAATHANMTTALALSRRKVRRKILKELGGKIRATLNPNKKRVLFSSDYKRILYSPLFDAAWYLRKYPDVAAAKMDPILHYLRYGGIEGRSAGPYFDGKEYLRANRDVEANGINPLLHFLRHGAAERRALGCDTELAKKIFKESAATSVAVTDVDIRRLKEPIFGREVAVFVTHTADGTIKAHVPQYLRMLKEQGIDVILVIVADLLDAVNTREIEDLVSGLFVRFNRGYDFAAWAHVLRLHDQIFSSKILYLLNDSVFGPLNQEKFSLVLDCIRKSQSDVVGLTDSYEHAWHLQSFFLALKEGALSAVAFHRFLKSIVCLDNKDEVIRTYEVRMADIMQQQGLKCEALFKSKRILGRQSASDSSLQNMTLFHWKKLIRAGFPFVKVMALRDANENIDISDWRKVISGEGYDATLIDDVLRHGNVLERSSGQCTAPKSYERASGGHRVHSPGTRVAFIGPWNYDNGLGFASRGYVSALWHTDLRVNLHAISAPFHIHKRMTPINDICTFDGPADVAIIHLNPDGWPALLSGEHIRIIRQAQKVVGLWVWETTKVPKNWANGFDKVDAIWAPSQYCADVFAANANVRVDVVPHVVPLPTANASIIDQQQLRKMLGFDARRRIILYCFDGSSYVVRKNPSALVAAFDMSGLARDGWVLVLKTKNLQDAGHEGELLRDKVERTAGVLLVDRSLNREMMAALMSVADIYASPHCSEGFGLTIAEAMARGKSVVSTDYSGSRDYLDATCGYPVDFTLQTLAQDHGHYTAGNSWAKVDEVDLERALRAAAKGVLEQTAIGELARQRIAQRLSANAVGEIILRNVVGLLETQ